MLIENIRENIREILEKSKSQAYIGEEISQYEHAVQCGELAIKAGADKDLILAAFLHDIGHLVFPPGSSHMGNFGIDSHEDIGAEYLLSLGFSQRTANLVRNHVKAKRYLVATNPNYKNKLSNASIETLKFQGGPMAPKEAAEFAADPDFKDILRLRAWDEQAKIVGYKPAHEEELFSLLLKN